MKKQIKIKITALIISVSAGLMLSACADAFTTPPGEIFKVPGKTPVEDDAEDQVQGQQAAEEENAGEEPAQDQNVTQEESAQEERPVQEREDAHKQNAEPDQTAESDPGGEDISDDLLFTVTKRANARPDEVRYYLIDDFDGDGSQEGFVYVGDEPDPDWLGAMGTIWFVNGRECTRIHDEWDFYVSDDEMFRVIECGGKSFIAFDEAYTTSLVTNVYYVSGSKAIESDISRIGNVAGDGKSGDITITYSMYDMSCTYEQGHPDEAMWLGHTWKPYYFYYDEYFGDFREYKGYEITEDNLASICGFDLAGEIRAEGFEVEEIYRRDNGIVSVNYRSQTEEDGMVTEDYGNANYDENSHEFISAWGDEEKTWQNSDFGGKYEASMIP